MLTHSVYFWLKPGMTEETALFESKLGALGGIEFARKVTVGKPGPTNRPVVERSYTYGLMVLLDDMAGHDAYQVHPLHKDFLEHCAKFFQKVVVYDFEG